LWCSTKAKYSQATSWLFGLQSVWGSWLEIPIRGVKRDLVISGLRIDGKFFPAFIKTISICTFFQKKFASNYSQAKDCHILRTVDEKIMDW
ncbi:18403_t:CDS:1, partial [Acaulospora morrowiae]